MIGQFESSALASNLDRTPGMNIVGTTDLRVHFAANEKFSRSSSINVARSYIQTNAGDVIQPWRLPSSSLVLLSNAV